MTINVHHTSRGSFAAKWRAYISRRRDGTAVIKEQLCLADGRPAVTAPRFGRRGGGIRGKIQGFSRQSRQRLLNLAYRCDPVGAEFVTLTVGGKSCTVEYVRKKFRAWVKRQKRSNSDFGCLWRLELQKRGAPHYHLIAWGLSEKSKSDWVDLVRDTHDNRDDLYKYAYKSEAMTSDGGVVSYCAKYCAKVQDKNEATFSGRCWGREGNLPLVRDEYVGEISCSDLYCFFESIGVEPSKYVFDPDNRENLYDFVRSLSQDYCSELTSDLADLMLSGELDSLWSDDDFVYDDEDFVKTCTEDF